jgi:TP901 family phage tail tape measure protein
VPRTVSVKVLADMSRYMAEMRRGVAATKDLKGELDRAARGGQVEQLTQSTGALGLGLVGAAGMAVKMSADFDKAMSGVAAATHASASEIDLLRKAALQAGKDTQFSATEAAKGITELSKAGISTANILGGGLKGALDLAAAGQLEVADAAEITASALTQFKLKGKDVPHVADLLAAAAGKAQGSVKDMGMALSQAGLVASQTGLTIEETTGGLAAFASAGLTGSDAGTSFKQMLLMLQAPSGTTRDLMDELGVSAYDAQGQFVGLTALAQQLRDKLGHLTPELRANAMAQIFGADAVRGASILYEQGGAGIQDWINKTNDAGYAAETARIQTDNLVGDLERLKGSIETLAIEAGSGANGGLRILAQAANGLVDAFSDLPPVVGNTITVLAALGGGGLLLGAGWLRARQTSADLRAELQAMGPAGERAATGMSRLSSAATKAGIAFVALQAASAVFDSFQDDINPKIDALATGLERYAASGQIAGETSRVLGGDMDKLRGKFKFLADEGSRSAWVRNLQGGLESLVPGLKGTDESLANTEVRIKSIDQALAQMVSGGAPETARQAFDKLAKELATGDVSMAEFRKQFPTYAAALETAGAETAKTAQKTDGLTSALGEGEEAQEKYKSVAEATTGALKGQRDAFQVLSDAMKAETDPIFGLLDAQDKLTEAQKKASKAVKEHGRNSVEARQANRELASAAITLQEKTGTLSDTFNGKMSPALRDTLKAANLTEAQIKDVGAQFVDARKKAEDYEGDYKAKATAPGAKQAQTDLKNAYSAANDFAGPYRADVSISGDKEVGRKLSLLSQVQSALKRGAQLPAPARAYFGKFDIGGWTGPGEKDDVAGVVHADEHVIRKVSRRKLEAVRPGALDYMNQTGEWPGYARGGRVGWPYPTTAAMTRIPSAREVSAAVVPSVPGGATAPWMERMLEARFGAAMISGFRPGSRTLSGNQSYHALNRAVDFPAIREMAAYMYQNYKSRLKEAITPWQQYNVHNGRSHRYTGAIWNQHNFAGGNAHNHFAMARGGTIREPVLGIGASGATYSFGENYQPERVTANWQPNGTGVGGSITIVLPNNGVIGSPYEMESWLAKAVDNLRARGRM